MRVRHDHAILILTLALLVIGIGVLYSASSELAHAATGDGLRFVKKQLVNAAVGLVAMLLMSQIDYRRWQRAARFLFVCAALVLGFLFLFDAVRGAQNWFPIGARSLQPVEFVRLGLIFFLAGEIVRRGPALRRLRGGSLPLFAALVALMAIVVKQNDFGSAMILGLVGFTMLFVGGVRSRHLVVVALVMMSACAVYAAQRPHVRDRVVGFVQPGQHAMDAAYQGRQSVMSIGSGGPLGKGLGRGISKYGYVPDPHTDFVFAVMGEEFGFVGSIVVLTLFLMLIARAIRIARAHEDPFAQLVAIGIGVSVFWYVMVNILVATQLFPVTGLPLPFVSYGGSSLVSHLMALGVLRNIAHQVEQPARARSRWVHRRGPLMEGGL